MAKAKTAKAVKAAKVPETVYISEADQYLFAQGTHYDIYKKLGAHQSVEDGKKGMSFAVWAPHAASVFVIGTFNSWNETANQMEKLGPGGIYKTFIPDVGLGELYKFLIITPDGRKLYKADPFANQGEVRPGTASVTTDITNFKWSDSKWIEERSAQDPEKAPVAIYECHIGSWMKHPVSDPEKETGFYNVRIFNEYNYGSYLLYRGIPVFIDSRADLYSPEFNSGVNVFEDSESVGSFEMDIDEFVEKYNITHIILSNQSQLNKVLKKIEGTKYKLVKEDENFSFYKIENL